MELIIWFDVIVFFGIIVPLKVYNSYNDYMKIQKEQSLLELEELEEGIKEAEAFITPLVEVSIGEYQITTAYATQV